MGKLNIFLSIAFVLIGMLTMHANEISDAAAAYQKGEYGKAIEIYQKIARENGTSSELLFNMGQVYTKAGNFGQAMLCYQRAVKLDPSNREARSNIKYVDSKVQDANSAELKGKKFSVMDEHPTFFRSVKNYITTRHSSNTWAVWGGVMFVLLCGSIALYVFTSNVLLRKIGFFGGGVQGVLCVIFIVFAFMSARASEKHDRGVITGYKVELKSDPSTSARSVATPLTQGTVMSVMEVQKDSEGKDEWFKVRLNSDFAGWVKADNFEVI